MEVVNFTSLTTEKSRLDRCCYIEDPGSFICMFNVAVFRTMNQFLQQNKSYRSSELILLYNGFWRVICSPMMPLVENNKRISFPTENVGQSDVLGWVSLPIFVISGFTTTFVQWNHPKYYNQHNIISYDLKMLFVKC